jgi:hypothetical protein
MRIRTFGSSSIGRLRPQLCFLRPSFHPLMWRISAVWTPYLYCRIPTQPFRSQLPYLNFVSPFPYSISPYRERAPPSLSHPMNPPSPLSTSPLLLPCSIYARSPKNSQPPFLHPTSYPILKSRSSHFPSLPMCSASLVCALSELTWYDRRCISINPVPSCSFRQIARWERPCMHLFMYAYERAPIPGQDRTGLR